MITETEIAEIGAEVFYGTKDLQGLTWEQLSKLDRLSKAIIDKIKEKELIK